MLNVFKKRKGFTAGIALVLSVILLLQVISYVMISAETYVDLETNMTGWTGLAFDSKTGYSDYNITGSLVSNISYDWPAGAYTTSDTAPDGTKSFTLDTTFILYGPKITDGAMNGWSEAGVVLGAKSREQVHLQANLFSLSHVKEENWTNSNLRRKENNTIKETVPMTRAQYDAERYDMFFTYHAETQVLTVKLNGDVVMTLENAKEIVNGNIGFAAVWNYMKVTKAIYTEIEEQTEPNAETGETNGILLLMSVFAVLSISFVSISSKEHKRKTINGN